MRIPRELTIIITNHCPRGKPHLVPVEYPVPVPLPDYELHIHPADCEELDQVVETFRRHYSLEGATA